MKLVIIDYGAGNVFSVKSAFERLGITVSISSNKEEITTADRVVFPGVGHASAAMEKLKSTGLDKLIPRLTQPVLGVCLGMQLMCELTEEGNEKGLGIFDGLKVLRFNHALNIPHMGWNNLMDSEGFLENITKDVYFVHSYYVPISSYTIASCQYGIEFSAALQKDNFYACQFHPEKSGKVGEEILKRFLNT
jgi:glutamine amidotransferase